MVVLVFSSFLSLCLLAGNEVMLGEFWAVAIAELAVGHVRRKMCCASMVAILSGLLFGVN